MRIYVCGLLQANEIRMYRDQADECSRRANEAKRRKEALGREEGRLQAQLQHQVVLPPLFLVLILGVVMLAFALA